MKFLFATISLFLAVAAPAAADSIVYAKQGDLYLTSGDGSRTRRLTTDGGYSSPSQAVDGTVGAIRNKHLVRLSPDGRLLNEPIAAMGTSGRDPIGGPYEARISPDGSRFAYYFYVQTSFDDYENDRRWIDTGSYGTWTYADRFTSPASDSEFERSFTQPEWVANDRLLGTQGMFMNMWTWKLGTGHGYTYSAAQWWFGLRDPLDEWGVAAYHWYDDPSLSRDGSRIAMTDSGQQLVIATTNGPAWSGEPPYPEPDYVNPDSGFAVPTIVCRGPVGKTENPTWSADGTRLAYGAEDGVHVVNADCSGDTLLVPGGYEPAFGPADVPADAAPAPAAAATLSRLSLRPRVFHSRTTVRFTLSVPARVTLKVKGAKAIGVDGKAGRNAVRFTPRRISHGRHTLVVSVAGTRITTTFRLR